MDGIHRKLYYAGHEINDLAKNCCFEEGVYLLWNDELPTRKQLDAFRADIHR